MPPPDVDTHTILYLALVALAVLWIGIGALLKRAIDHVDEGQRGTTEAVKELGGKIDTHNARLAVVETRQSNLDAEFGRLRGELEGLRTLLDRRSATRGRG